MIERFTEEPANFLAGNRLSITGPPAHEFLSYLPQRPTDMLAWLRRMRVRAARVLAPKIGSRLTAFAGALTGTGSPENRITHSQPLDCRPESDDSSR